MAEAASGSTPRKAAGSTAHPAPGSSAGPETTPGHDTASGPETISDPGTASGRETISGPGTASGPQAASESTAGSEKLVAYLKRVTAELHETRGRLRRAEDSAREPIAIVGVGCRLPGGVDSPQRLWELVSGGHDAIGEVPADRGWDVTYPGGFLQDVAGFDAGFFGISPREAAAMDPQQRLLLETAWEAFERAGIAPRSPESRRTGVFAGLVAQEYGPRLDEASDDTGGHVLTGTTASVASGRIAYTFDFDGPAVTVDTACSSSLVALHLAAQALRRGDCDLALAGGVCVLPTPGTFLSFERQGGLAADGRCKAFGAGADGTGWSEGAVLLLVERLSDARRNRHPVLAVVRGSAVNQDGASNGLSAPSGPAQERVIRAALADAGLTAADIDAVEAHGTGTRLGDPIEAEALLGVYGAGRPADRPLWLGSLKSNIGHTQAAAGAAGVVKTLLAMRHGVLPPTLHVTEPTPEVDWSDGTVRLLTDATQWPQTGRPRRAGVSSFGISGTNAHVILEQAPDATDFGDPNPDSDLDTDADAGVGAAATDHASATATAATTTVTATVPFTAPPLLPWPLTARSRAALRDRARTLHRHLEATPGASAADVARSLAATRVSLEHRAVALAPDRDGLLTLLAQAAEDGTPQGLVRGRHALPGAARTVFVFPGQGSQWAGMAVDLLDSSPVFARRMAACEAVLAPYTDWRLTDVLRAPDIARLLTRVDVVQPVLWAVAVSLAELWAACGLRPDAVLGHSQGEIAAAVVAGALTLDDGARVVALRSRALTELPERGGMLSVAEPADAVRARLLAHSGRLGIGAVNGPASTVVTGDAAELDALEAACVRDGVRARRVDVDYASHSPSVAALEDRVTGLLAPVRPLPGRVAYYSSLTGGRLDTTGLDAGYWYRSLRHTVRFEEATRAALDDGHTVFVEVSPHPVLVGAVQGTLDTVEGATAVLGTLRRGPGGRPERFVEALAEAYAHGADVDWTALLAGTGGRRVELPTYPFQRSRHWLGRPSTAGTDDPATAGLWEAVDRDDVPGVAERLGIRPDDSLADTVRALAARRADARRSSTIDRCRYRVTWKPVPEPADRGLTGDWVLLAPGGETHDGTDRPCPPDTPGLVDWTTRALLAHGAARVHPVTVTAATPREELAALLRRHATAAGVVSLLGTDVRPHPGHPAVPTGVAATLTAVQALLDAGGTGPRMWCLTRGAVTTRADGELGPLGADGSEPGSGAPRTAGHGPSPEQAQIWGLGRAVGLETPGVWGGLVDLPEHLDDTTARTLGAVLAAPGDEQEWALRGGTGPRVRRLVRAPRPTATSARHWRPRGTVLITGGTGALGGHVARRLAADGADHLILTGRRGAEAPGAVELAEELRALGARVTLAACDTADRDALAAVLDAIPADHPLSAVVHAAGVSALGRLDTATPADLAATADGKVSGARHLDDLLADRDLDAFVLFSSGAAVWGGARQAAYAAANAHLDALAARRRARGLAATCVAWGSWGGGGMVDDRTRRVFERIGLRAMAPDTAVGALVDAVARDETRLTVTDMDWRAFAAGFRLSRRRTLLDDIPEAADRPEAAEASPGDQGTAGPSALADALAGLTDRDRDRRLLDLVRSSAAAALGHADTAEVGAGAAFRDLGLDSVTAVDLRNRLAAATGLTLPSTFAFDHPTPTAVAAALRDLLAPGRAAAAAPAPVPVAADDPVAVVAMSCRLPGGVTTPEDLWRLVAEGRDGITPFPADRGWSTAASADGNALPGEGGFLHDLAGFDAAFFGISPREALAMDPQQRLLLEVSWEAIERAGIDPLSLRGSRTGVFVGAGHFDYASLALATEEGKDYALTGSAGSVLSGRIAYTLGLEGPAVTVDTACSSSLVALHNAARALRDGECRLALVGGAAVMATTSAYEAFARQGGLAADGRCKAFADAADGTGWSEGVGVLVVERLSDARRNGHPVLAVVRGSAVNQDGASNGLTAPSGPSQQRVIRDALASAGLSPSEVDAVEAHGTGTRLGDPIEAQAVLAAYGQNRERPLYLGSLKSNIGHAQAASGVAGVIKTVLALRHGVLPRTLHVDEPTGQVDWSAGAVELLTKARDWPDAGRPRRAGVSSFGVSGTNAHIILEQGDETEPAADETRPGPDRPEARPLPVVPVLLSARGATALRAQAARLRELLDDASQPPALHDIGLTLAAHRATLDHRAAVPVADEDTLRAALDALAQGRPYPGLLQGTGAVGGGLAVVFSGQGAQRVGMGRDLYEAFPVFAEAFDEVCAGFDGLLPGSLKRVVLGGPAEELESTGWAQPALFAVEVALFRLLVSWGVRADVVMGHSLGELVAAHVAGVWSLGDACRVVAARAGLMGALPSGGVMWAVEARESEVAAVGGVAVAAVNGPSSLVLSGAEDAVGEVVGRFVAEGRRVKRLAVSHAFHSALMEPMLEEFAGVLAGVAFGEASVPVVSNVTGEVAGPELSTPEYWVRHVRATVRFADGVRALRAQDVSTVLEVGPDGTLVSLVQETSPETAGVAALRRGRDEPAALLSALAELHVHGVAVGWREVFAGTGARRADLPTYTFQHRRFWPEGAGTAPAGALRAAGLGTADHPLLRTWLVRPDGDGVIATGRIAPAAQPWLADHKVLGTVLLPGTAFVDMACWAGRRLGCPELPELTLSTPLALSADAAADVQLVVGGPDEEGRRSVVVHSRPVAPGGTADDALPWTRHAEGTLAPGTVPEDTAAAPLAWPPARTTPLPLDGFYPGLIEAGFDYGPAFQGLRSVLRADDGTLYAEVELDEDDRGRAGRFAVHPALLDAALHPLGVDLPPGAPARLPFAWTGVRVHATGADALKVRLIRSAEGVVSLSAVDADGAPVVTVEGLVLRETSADRLPGPAAPDRDALFRIEWTGLPVPVDAAPVEPVPLPLREDGSVDLARVEGLPDAVVTSCPSGDVEDVTARVLRLLQGWLADERYAAVPLVVVTRRAAVVATASPLPSSAGATQDTLAQAAAAGLVRAAQAEHPGRIVLVDMDTPSAPAPAEHPPLPQGLPLAEVLACGEPDVAVRGGRVYGRRLARAEADAPLRAPAGPWRLDRVRDGSLGGLEPVPHPEADRNLAPGEVRVAVRAAGVNFRDTMIALDMYPGDAELGIEGAGVVLATGPGVTRFAPGDRVTGLLDAAFAPVAVTDERLLAPVPDGWTFARAAAAPVAGLTAWYGLRDLGGVGPGNRVLVHAGAGGVGSVAVRLARYLGAEVYATASRPKWDALRAAGLDDAHIADSRDTGFRERFLAHTTGAGMDVVLNCLAGEFTDASLELLPRGGVFVEIGKTDPRDPDRVAADHPGVRHRAFDLGDAGPDRIREMLGELTVLFADGSLTPPPVTTWDIHRAPEAFRAVARAGLVGKAVLTVAPDPAPGGTVLITGGTGTLGAQVARHLAGRHGVRRLVLTSRSGDTAPGATGLLAELAAAGAEAHLAACDVGDRTAVAALLDRLAAEGHRLTGAVHCAGTVDDGVLTSLTPDRVERVLHAKAHGARHLDELTRALDLSSFVLFSSASATFGAAGQANYCAANAYLDALAERRAADGLPAVSIAWGLWDEASGMTAALGARDRERLLRTGTGTLSTERALALYDAALTARTPAVTAAPLDLARLRAAHPDRPAPALLSTLLGPVPRRAAARRPEPSGAGFATTLAALPEEDRPARVLALVRDRTAQVLGHTRADEVDPDQAFKDQGFDSLTAVELRNRLKTATGLDIPATLVFDHPSPSALADHLLLRLLPTGPGPREQLRRDLERLETTAEALAADDPSRTETADRLRRILRLLDTTAAAPTGPADGDETLSAATADEVIAFIDSEFGDLT